MPRRLILIPRSPSRLVDATTIEPGYTKGYTPDEMRMWADDLGRLYRTPAEDLDRWQAMPAHQLTPEQQRTLAARDAYFTDPQRGIKGSLREDGTVGLDGGRHRAGYMLERGVDPVPVWVSARDQRELDAFAEQCERELPRERIDNAPREQAPPRVAPEDQPRERELRPDADQRGDRVRT